MHENSPENKRKEKIELVRFVVISMIIIFLIRTFLITPFLVDGPSMDNTYHDGDYILVDRLSYRFSDPERGDVIVFEYPVDPSTDFIKRIIGLPGEEVHIAGGKLEIVNGDKSVMYEEKYIDKENMSPLKANIKLKENEYFVAGDNRINSLDSRSWGALERKFILGKPILRLYPFDQISINPGKATY